MFLPALRLSIGLVQGLLLWRLHVAAWPATELVTLRALLSATLIVPAVAIVSVGNLRRGTLLGWLGAGLVLCLAFGAYAGFRQSPTAGIRDWWNAAAFVAALAGLFFVAQALVTAGDKDHRWIASFETYFDIAWKLASQVVLAALFVGAFWLILWLGATLFGLIGIKRFSTIIGRNWFWIPTTAVAAAAALHLTDSQASMVRGARTLLLNLLSWLMPLMVAIGLAFLAALPFTGLEPLWHTRHATGSLLAASIVLILLINAHFQDGHGERPVGVLLYARMAGALMLTPLTVLAALGVGLRVDQHGWTPARIIALAVLIIVACHAAGYGWSTLRSGIALRGLPRTNVLSALAAVLVTCALLTPLADPARLAVNDQVRRLTTGMVPPTQFDYRFLRFASGRYGEAALKELSEKRDGPGAAEIAQHAAAALAPGYSRWAGSAPKPPPPPATTATRASNITVVHPKGATLPGSFLEQAWRAAFDVPRCLTSADVTCTALILDLDDDGKAEVVLVDERSGDRAVVFGQASSGAWQRLGAFQGGQCAGALKALRSGDFEIAPAIAPDIVANGRRLRFVQDCDRRR
jgi:hypothetical protein